MAERPQEQQENQTVAGNFPWLRNREFIRANRGNNRWNRKTTGGTGKQSGGELDGRIIEEPCVYDLFSSIWDVRFRLARE
jgi:hypothetical protein